MNVIVQGVGINDLDEPIFGNGKHVRYYSAWARMLQRCYSLKFQQTNVTYIGCSVCDEWKYLSNFKKWFDENYVEGFHLDKDILVEDNKEYGPETCRYVPEYLNKLLNDSKKTRGDFPLGVSEQKPNPKSGRVNSSYVAQCSNGYGKHLQKTFKTIEEASAWYSVTKARIVKEQAQRAFLDNAIKTDVYLALVRRKF